MNLEFERVRDKNYLICIPTRGRSDLIRKGGGVYRYISNPQDYNLRFFVRRCEELNYSGQEITKGRLHFVDDDFTIADKREAMLRHCIDNSIEYLFIIDDDVVFYHRNEDLRSKYECRLESVVKNYTFDKILLESTNICSEKYPAVGLPLKMGSNGRKYTLEKNSPIIRFVCYHVPTLARLGLKMNGMKTPFMSDRYAQLFLLSRGFRSITNCRYAIDETSRASVGGCHLTRTTELQSKSALELKSIFPETVSLKFKSNGPVAYRRIDCSMKLKTLLEEGEEPFIDKELYKEDLK